MNRLKKAAATALDLLYPPALYCVCCGKIIDRSRTYSLCNECMKGIKWISGRTCSKCGRELGESNPGDCCYNCRTHPHAFDRGYTCTEYGTHERAVVFSMKYDGRPDIATVTGEILADRMLAEFSRDELAAMYDAALPVPVHPSKKARRGYNQAALIAGEFCRRTSLTLEIGRAHV